ncbi:MAG: tetratricopeptide repeat protein [bacterium]
MTEPTLDQTAAALADAETRKSERLRPALNAAERLVRRRTAAAVADRAVADLRRALIAAGVAALDGGDPQRIEDALLAAWPDSPLAEDTLRAAWLALVDDLARTGDKPPFGGSGGAETWAATARARRWPFADPDDHAGAIAGRFGTQAVVVVRGPGTSTLLAAVRRRLLGAHGPDALVPPVVPAARDDLAGVLLPYVQRAPLPDELRAALDKLRYAEDLLGVLGRAGDKAPIALLLDDAHLQSRAVLLGLPLFIEPAPTRNVLLVLGGPADPADDGPLADVVVDARSRGILTEIALPAWGEDRAAALLAAAGADRSRAAALAAATPGPGAEGLAEAHAWIADLDRLGQGFDLDAHLPAHQGARAALALAAVDGDPFHGFAVGRVLGHDEDWVEDLMHDDEFELDGAEVGTCAAAVPPEGMGWSDLPDGLHPTFRWSDARIPAALRRGLDAETRKKHALALRDALLAGYTAAGAWQIADRVWRLSREAGDGRPVQHWLLSTRDAPRVEAGFRRMLPILNVEAPYLLALARLYGSAMEAGALGTMTGRVQLADQSYQAAAAAAQRMGRPGAAGEALARLGEVRLALALPQPATAALDLAEKLLQSAGEPGRSVARLSLLRAEIKVLEGEIDDALDQLKRGVDALRRAGDAGHVSLGLVRLGRLLYERGNDEAAILALDEAIRTADQSRDPRAAGAARMARAFVHGEQNQLEPAFALLQQAVGAFQAAGMPVHILEVAAAGLQRRHGNAAEAEKRLRAVGETFKKARAAVQWADAWHALGRCLVDQEKYTDAITALDEVKAVRLRARDRFGLVRLYEDLGDAKVGQGDRIGAHTAYGHARRLAERLGLAARLGRLDAALARLAAELEGVPDVDPKALRAQADDEIDAMEALWKAPPQAVQQSGEVH